MRLVVFDLDGTLIDSEALIVGAVGDTAWLTNTTEASRVFGYPLVPLGTMLDWVADWVARAMPSLHKPTRYEARNGAF